MCNAHTAHTHTHTYMHSVSAYVQLLIVALLGKETNSEASQVYFRGFTVNLIDLCVVVNRSEFTLWYWFSVQKIVAFENAFERLIDIIEGEGYSDGGVFVWCGVFMHVCVCVCVCLCHEHMCVYVLVCARVCVHVCVVQYRVSSKSDQIL